MKIFKTKEVLTPLISTTLSVGIDFYVPVFDDNFIKDFTELNKMSKVQLVKDESFKPYIRIEPHQLVKIPLGVIIEMDKHLACIFKDKSSIATNNMLSVVGGVIDSDYTKEWILCLQNYSDSPQLIKQNTKIVQGVLINKVSSNITVVSNFDELFIKLESNRSGGFGSTGKY